MVNTKSSNATLNIAHPGLALTAALLLSQIVACTPRQFGSDQVPDVNVAMTDLKDDSVPGLPASVDAVVNGYINATGGPPGCAVGVMENNTISGLEGYGLADISQGRAFTVGTPSEVGSISKTWTALAILRLQEMGYLDIDDSLSAHLSGIPVAWQGLTLRELLSHTSGLAREAVFHPALDTEVELSQLYFPMSPPILQLGIHPRLVYPAYMGTPVVGFEASNTARYSNAGFLLLGAVIDKIVADNAGLIGEEFASYESFVWRQVGLFDGTLGNGDQMISPSLYEYWRLSDIPDLAMGYVWDQDNSVHVEKGYWNDGDLMGGPAGWEGPAGGWTMTIGDLTRLMMALQHDDIITSTTRTTEMMVIHGQEGGSKYGLGVFLISKLGRPVYMHAGVHSGYSARYTVWPSENFGVAVLCNSRTANTRDLTDDVAEIYIGNSGVKGVASDGGFGSDGRLGNLTKLQPGDALPIGSTPGNGSEPLPSAALASRLTRGLDTLEDHQLATEADHASRLQDLETLGCFDLAGDTIADEGVAVTAPFLACFDTSSSPTALQSCVQSETNRLILRGVLLSSQRAQVEACFDVLAY